MNDERKIIDAIMEDAKKEADKIIRNAENEVDAMLAEAKLQAESENAPAIEKAKRLAADTVSKDISSAEMEAKKLMLAEKQKILSETIGDARARLDKLSPEEYRKTIGTMLESAGFPAEGSSVILSGKDKARAADIFTARGFLISDEVRNINGGFIVKTGDIEYNYTFDSIFNVSREQIEETAAKILFG